METTDTTTEPKSGARPTQHSGVRARPTNRGRYWYFVVGIGAAVSAIVLLRPWKFADANLPIGDRLWVQAMVTVHGQVGPFGVTENLAYPAGASPWELPQLGILLGTLAWIGIGWLNLTGITFVHWFVVLATALNAVALLYFLRALVGPRLAFLSATLSTILATSFWIIANVAIPNLSLIAVVPLTIGTLLRWPAMHRNQRILALGALWAVAALSPAWWVVVMALVLPWMVIAPAVRRQWSEVIAVLAVWAATATGLLLQVVLQLVASGSMSDRMRTPWDSLVASGGLLDIVHASPALNAWIDRLALLGQATSGWAQWGMSAAALAAISVFAVLATGTGMRMLHLDGPILASATTVSLLYLFSGGLGAVQAAVAVLAGTESPARWWSRMTLVLAVLGAGWLVAALGASRQEASNDRRDRRMSLLAGGIAVFLTLGWGADHVAGPDPADEYRTPPAPASAVAAITSRTDPCPVAQLPVDPIPTTKLSHPFFTTTLYRDLMPYVLEPNYFWSAGSDDAVLTDLPLEITTRELAELRQAGFCAVLFSRDLRDLALDQDVDLPGRELGPKLEPDYSDDHFDVLILDGEDRSG